MSISINEQAQAIKITRLEAELIAERKLLKVARCPVEDCVDGAYPTMPDGEAEQCQWCCERDELLARQQEGNPEE